MIGIFIVRKCKKELMRKYFTYLLAALFALSTASCYTSSHHHHGKHGHLPPGQAKKIYGDKSAKRHAPGQQKKKHHKSKHHKH